MALCIRNHISKNKLIMLEMFPADKIKNVQLKFKADWNIHYKTGERLPFCTYQESKNDSLFKYFISNLEYPLKNSIPVSIERINFLKDSLEKEFIYYKHLKKDETYELYEIKKTNNKGKVTTNRGFFRRSYSHSNTQFGVQEIPKGFNYFFLGKTIDSNKEEKIVFEQIIVEDAPPRFQMNEIGKLPADFDIHNFKSKTLQVPITNVSQMAVEITKPYLKELDKVAAIYLWIHHNIPYDHIGLENHNAAYTTENTLKKKSGVCAGQANLFKDLCKAAGIQCNYIIGTSTYGNQTSHAWNAVCIEGKWYLADVTWGLNYFLINPWSFYKSHFPIENKWTLLPEFCSFEQFKMDTDFY